MRTRDENKEQLVRKKAIELIVKEGLDGFSMNKVARAAGVSPATLYIYFKDKEDFITRITLEAANTMMAYSMKDFDAEMSFEKGLMIQWHNRLHYLMENSIEMEFIEIMRYTIYYESVTEMLVEIFGGVMGRFIQNAVKNKELLELPFEVYWSVAFAPLYQLIKFHNQGNSYANSSFSLTNEHMKKAFDLVIKALKP
ncbi:MAG TPA: TetR/AcrR family transcriptional regulator [Mucilaginibacter sp.]